MVWFSHFDEKWIWNFFKATIYYCDACFLTFLPKFLLKRNLPFDRKNKGWKLHDSLSKSKNNCGMMRSSPKTFFPFFLLGAQWEMVLRGYFTLMVGCALSCIFDVLLLLLLATAATLTTDDFQYSILYLKLCKAMKILKRTVGSSCSCFYILTLSQCFYELLPSLVLLSEVTR